MSVGRGPRVAVAGLERRYIAARGRHGFSSSEAGGWRWLPQPAAVARVGFVSNEIVEISSS